MKKNKYAYTNNLSRFSETKGLDRDKIDIVGQQTIIKVEVLANLNPCPEWEFSSITGIGLP